MSYAVEYTDTFGGEANYCWVKRAIIESPFDGIVPHATATRRLKREAKAQVGLTGVKGAWSDYGDSYEFRPRDMRTVLFVTGLY